MMGSSLSKKLVLLVKGKLPSNSQQKRSSAPELDSDGVWKLQHGNIGTGASACVRVISQGGHSRKFAIKMFLRRHRESATAYKQRVEREFYIATISLGNRKGTLYCVMEYCSAGDLFYLVEKDLRWEHKKRLLKQLLRGIKYLHERGIAHRDIKPENIVMADPNCLKICDFGDAIIFRNPDASGPSSGNGPDKIDLCYSRGIGTKGYHPPELARPEPYDPRPMDVWGAGITCLFMFIRGYAWEVPDPEKDTLYALFDIGWRVFRLDLKDRMPTDTIYPACSGCFQCLDGTEPGLRTLFFRMLDPDPAKRITIDEALNLPWVQAIDC
ncbi:kinase-like domain-containing protein [Aspergillus floccosus]